MDLNKERVNLIVQRDNAYAAYHQSLGAIALLDELLKEEHAEVAEAVQSMIEPSE